MGKGVKKIKQTDGNYYPKMSVAGQRVTIKADEFAWFEVSEWEKDTNAEDKKKSVTWMRQSNDRKIIISQMTIPASNKYGVKIPKKLCGSYHYYIEASLSGKRDFKNNTGLYVKGFAPPIIVSSKWCTQNDGADQRDRYFSFGENVFLGLETEGINKHKVTIELYRLNSELTLSKLSDRIFDKNYDPTKDDAKAKVFEKQAEVLMARSIQNSPYYQYGKKEMKIIYSM